MKTHTNIIYLTYLQKDFEIFPYWPYFSSHSWILTSASLISFIWDSSPPFEVEAAMATLLRLLVFEFTLSLFEPFRFPLLCFAYSWTIQSFVLSSQLLLWYTFLNRERFTLIVWVICSLFYSLWRLSCLFVDVFLLLIVSFLLFKGLFFSETRRTIISTLSKVSSRYSDFEIVISVITFFDIIVSKINIDVNLISLFLFASIHTDNISTSSCFFFEILHLSLEIVDVLRKYIKPHFLNLIVV